MGCDFNDPVLIALLFAVLVKRLGGSVKITQAEIDDVAFQFLKEEGSVDGAVEFSILERKLSG